MTTNLNPAVAKEIVKPKKKDESEKALERAGNTDESAADQSDYDPEADLAETAEQNDLVKETPLHGNTH